MHKLLLVLALAATLLNPFGGAAACTLAGFAAHYVQVYRSQGMVDDCYYQLVDDLGTARAVQLQVVALLAQDWQRAGYKVGLTDSKARDMFGISQPLVGVLFKEMLLPDGAVVELDSATSLLVELDLLARVKSAAINQAETVAEVARHIDAVIPFIELPDVLFTLDGDNPAALLVAGNVGAKWGVVGKPVSVTNARELVESLPTMTLQLTDDTGAVLRAGQGSLILEHPLNSILFLQQELTLSNETMKPGQLISLGAIGGPVKAERGRRYTAKYTGFGAGNVSVSVLVQ
ncbi:MAG: hypothetical protein OXD47_05555 [Gammaproteobacteria bacterium]|nr:hypothetical protein [Gammaproteobacteria bacterium]